MFYYCPENLGIPIFLRLLYTWIYITKQGSPSVLGAPAEQTKVATIGPSGAVQTVSDSRRPLF